MSKIIKMPEHENANCRMAVSYAWNSRTEKYSDIAMIELWSYSTHVATYWANDVVEGDKLTHHAGSIEIFGWWSVTTARHILWFKQYIAQAIYQKGYNYCWWGDCSKAKTISATVYNPTVIFLR